MNYPMNNYLSKKYAPVTRYSHAIPVEFFQNEYKHIPTHTLTVSRLIRKVLLKSVVIMLLCGLNASTYATIGDTVSYYNDTETIGNTLTASSLDFTLTSTPDTEKLTRIFSLKKDGLLNFQYTVKATHDLESLCTNFSVEAKRNTISVYDGKINELNLAPIMYEDQDNWEFIFTDGGVSGICDFELEFVGWQKNFIEFGGYSHSTKNTLSLNTNIIPLINEPTMNNLMLEPFDISQTKKEIFEETEEITEETVADDTVLESKTPEDKEVEDKEDKKDEEEVVPKPEAEEAKEEVAESNTKNETTDTREVKPEDDTDTKKEEEAVIEESVKIEEESVVPEEKSAEVPPTAPEPTEEPIVETPATPAEEPTLE